MILAIRLCPPGHSRRRAGPAPHSARWEPCGRHHLARWRPSSGRAG